MISHVISKVRRLPRETVAIWGTGILAIAPLVVLRRDFAELFWFGDDWDLLDQLRRLGLGTWMWQVFAENFVPLFKLLWSGGVAASGGSYFGMLVLLWLTHALNTIQFGRLLRAFHFPVVATCLCQIAFGLTPANLETLGWATQWSAVLATTFLLFGLEWTLKAAPFIQEGRWQTVLGIFLFSSASALCFSRGVLTGCVLALAATWPVQNQPLLFKQRAMVFVVALLPAIVTAILISSMASGNHHALGAHLFDAADYALWYFCMNPLFRLIEMDSSGVRTLALVGGLKIALVIWGLLRCDKPQRVLLVLLLAYDLGNAALLGIGRYHTGLRTSISSRYQYSSLIATLPYLALWLHHCLGKIKGSPRVIRSATAALSVVTLVLIVRRWPQEIVGFAQSRGTETRRILFVEKNPPKEGAIPGISFLHTSTAKELVEHYDLH